MALDGAVLEIDFYNDAETDQTETAVFEIRGNIQIDEGIRPNFLVEDFGQNAVSIAETFTGFQTRRRSYTLDAGAGEHTFDIQFLGWEGSTNQWGNGNGSSSYEATGEDALKQIAVFNQVLSRATTDSFNPARLYIGEYTDGTYGTSGKFSAEAPLNVQVDGISGNVTAEEGKRRFNGTLNLTETKKLGEAAGAIDLAEEVFDSKKKLEF